MKSSVRIANSSGFWGDDPEAMKRQAMQGGIDYIVSDYLAEVSMSILQKQQAKNPEAGFILDFIKHFTEAAPYLVAHKIKVVTNAGGNNPKACAEALLKALEPQGWKPKIGIVEGDNIMPYLDDLVKSGEEFNHFETGKALGEMSGRIKSANAYIGIPALLKALQQDIDVLITGRATDSAVAIAPMVYELGWETTDWDKIGAGMIAAHIIECGGQATGGNFTDWHLIKDWNQMGFPIIEMHKDASFYVYKHPNTGGLVSVNTVKEQLVYEIADPANYYSPDVIADLRFLNVTQVEEHKVLVTGAKGKSPSPYYKMSMSYEAGFKAVGSIIISGENAVEKAQVFEKIFWERIPFKLDKTNTEMVGYNACHKSMITSSESNEILLRFHALDTDRKKIEYFTYQIAPLILSGPQGVAVTGGRPDIQTVSAYWPALLHKKFVPLSVYVFRNNSWEFIEQITVDTPQETVKEESETNILRTRSAKPIEFNEEYVKVKLHKLCLSRSGDKGNTSNIGLIARNEEIYNYLKEYLKPEFVKYWFRDLCFGEIIRYELPGLNAFNFMLYDALDGGGTTALRIDAQGKTFAAALLAQEIYIPTNLKIE
ncbi:MAG: acyclic terpene utilization AtuA family protein [Cytophagales bacterium]